MSFARRRSVASQQQMFAALAHDGAVDMALFDRSCSLVRDASALQPAARACVQQRRAASVVRRLVAGAILSIAGAIGGYAQGSETPVDFNSQIRPILASHCLACHGGVKQASGLSLIDRSRALRECDSGEAAIVPGDREQSELWRRVVSDDLDVRMPPTDHGKALTVDETELLGRWIDEGAVWAAPWAFTRPRDVPPPQSVSAGWSRSVLDDYVLARMEQAGLAPSGEADRFEWLRRVTLDLTGVPPSQEAYQAFADDVRPDAYERVVDELLASDDFGERWASMWLDLARYADTMGYEKDPHRAIWPYRDWVIRALNQNMPYDEFTIKQLAGDLLPDASLEDRLATAFHRNTQTNTEGGTDDEEFRTSATMDRVSTTWEAWMASTFRCAQCHNHPYDPLDQREYYEFLALFNTSRDADLNEEYPVLETPRDPQRFDEADALAKRQRALHQEIYRAGVENSALVANWTPLTPERASSTGNAQLQAVEDGSREEPELRASGTLTAGSVFTVDLRPQVGSDAVWRPTALQIAALPCDPDAAERTSEPGFMLTRFVAKVVDQHGAEVAEAPCELVLADEVEPLFDPMRSLADDDHGWASYTRLWRERRAWFVFSSPPTLRPGERLRVVLSFGRTDSGGGGLCIRRAQFACTQEETWNDEIRERLRRLQSELAEVRRKRSAIPSDAVPVMSEQPLELRRQTYVFVRGNWMD
ncbi:MAG: DUF1549 domain-containing protein, partial [Planctomycetales bacterium]|nr:DUF1549 domain-containing protein [Planctomycetales bacterium]